jgi:hypothetical protein
MDVYRFLKDGYAGPYRLGMALSEVLELDLNWLRESLDDGVVCLRDQNGVNVYFADDELYLINLEVNSGFDYFLKDFRMPFRGGMSEVIAQLRLLGIEWEFYSKYSMQDQVCIKTEGGVLLIYRFADHPEYLSKLGTGR